LAFSLSPLAFEADAAVDTPPPRWLMPPDAAAAAARLPFSPPLSDTLYVAIDADAAITHYFRSPLVRLRFRAPAMPLRLPLSPRC
jgi:hypothetical protein